MIKTFADKQTAAVFLGKRIKNLPSDISDRAHRKLLMIDAATELKDLLVPPGNKLEALKGDRKGQQSIRINNQWRICFVWKNAEAWDVQIVDYH